MNKALLLKNINWLVEILNKHDLVNEIRRDRVFNDEPRIYSFGTYLKSSKEFSDGIPIDIKGFGYSFHSPELAFFKSLMESIERLSNSIYKKKDLVFSSYSNSGLVNAINPDYFSEGKRSVEKQIFGWVEGLNLLSREKVLIPAQTVYINYKRLKNEPYISETISTGAAAGIDFESTTLRGIYEIVERDAFMTVYLNKISVPRVLIDRLEWKNLGSILKELRRFNLEIYVFDITNDLGIPTYMSILLDNTGIGPILTVGLKSSILAQDAIVGSIEESCLPRPWLRFEHLEYENNAYSIDPLKINSLLLRGLYWSKPKMLKNLDFLLNGKNTISKVEKSIENSEKQLKMVSEIFRKNNIAIYGKDITSSFFSKSQLHVYKIVIPKLQPLYLDERSKAVRMSRIKSVAQYFNVRVGKINPIPHPFL